MTTFAALSSRFAPTFRRDLIRRFSSGLQKSVNQAELCGTVVRDPFKFQYGPQKDKSGLKFTIVTNTRSTSDLDDQEFAKTTKSFHNVAVFAPWLVKAAQSVTKGSVVHVKGKLTYNSWQNKEGETVGGYSVTADHFSCNANAKIASADQEETPDAERATLDKKGREAWRTKKPEEMDTKEYAALFPSEVEKPQKSKKKHESSTLKEEIGVVASTVEADDEEDADLHLVQAANAV